MPNGSVQSMDHFVWWMGLSSGSSTAASNSTGRVTSVTNARMEKSSRTGQGHANPQGAIAQVQIARDLGQAVSLYAHLQQPPLRLGQVRAQVLDSIVVFGSLRGVAAGAAQGGQEFGQTTGLTLAAVEPP